MKATLQFDLDCPEDTQNYRLVNKASDLCHVLWELAHSRDDCPDGLCDECKKKLWQWLNDNNIAFEEIWS